MSEAAALQQRAAALEAEAEAVTRRYNRTTWIRFTITFFPVPLVVVIMRLRVESWVYYIYGAAIVALAVSMYMLDGAARDRCTAAIKAAEDARRLSDAASPTSSPPSPAVAG
ncbi:MAG: hypothetical protein JO055_09365 [Alphaproteobacteria bacterium]|nr:hypothetical protein [Alphaproteobacteria bacterium]